MFNPKVFGITLLLIILCVVLSVAVPGSFLTGNNIENLLRRTAMYGILGIGVAFVIITAGIDLSIGSIVCLAGCLLALFLKVDYRSVDHELVLAVEARPQVIYVAGEVDTYQVGDRIRFYGGRRAGNVIASVTNVRFQDYEQDGRTMRATAIQVDQPFTRNDRTGQVAKVHKVQQFETGQSGQTFRPGRVTIAGEFPELGARDQVTLVHPTSGLKQLTIDSAEVTGRETRLTLTTDLGSDFSTEWLAVPQRRHQRMPVLAALGLVLVIAMLLGWTHGLLITKMRLQPFVVTLCGLLIYRGVSRWLVDDQPQGFGQEYNDTLSPLATGKLTLTWQASGDPGFGIPYPFFILVIVSVVAAVFLSKTIWGRYMLALGRNKEAAEYSGINTDRMTTLAYIICTALAALGGMLFALDANSVSPSSFGSFYELYAIAAAVLGGCSLRGGEGGIFGVVIGTAVMQTLNNLILLLKISDRLEFAIIGLVILAGVTADELLKRWTARRR